MGGIFNEKNVSDLILLTEANWLRISEGTEQTQELLRGN